MKFFLTVFSVILSVLTYSQSSWNQNSFVFSKDIAPLENMVGGVNVLFSGSSPQPITSGVINFPSGFKFQFGLNTYSSFAISPFGFIRVGGNVISNIADQQDNVIVPIYNGTFWNASYSLIGTAPNRKMVIQWSGNMQPSGQPTSFQLFTPLQVFFTCKYYGINLTMPTFKSYEL